MTTTAMKTSKTNDVLLTNRQIHGEFTVIPSSENILVDVMVVAVIVSGRHCPTPYLPPDTSERARLTPAIKASTRLTYPGGMKG